MGGLLPNLVGPLPGNPKLGPYLGKRQAGGSLGCYEFTANLSVPNPRLGRPSLIGVPVLRLLKHGRPADVSWFVISVFVGESVDGVEVGRSRPDIIEECFKGRYPVRVYRNASAAVVFVCRTVRVKAPLLKAAPNAVFGSDHQWMEEAIFPIRLGSPCSCFLHFLGVVAPPLNPRPDTVPLSWAIRFKVHVILLGGQETQKGTESRWIVVIRPVCPKRTGEGGTKGRTGR